MGYITKRGRPELVVDRALLRGGTSMRQSADRTCPDPTSRGEQQGAEVNSPRRKRPPTGRVNS